MIRSLSVFYLFIVLAVGYLGGTLLFRQLPTESVEKMLKLFDARIIDSNEVTVVWPVLMTALFFGLVFVMSLIKKFRFPILLIGALKSVIFGLSSAYLLATGMKIIVYALWWFPFQLIICFLLLSFCALLSPPFFVRTIGRRRRNDKGLLTLVVLTAVVTAAEMSIFVFLLN